MKTGKIIFALCLLVLLSMASVNASDIDNSTIQTTDDASENIVTSDAVNHQDITGITDENNKLGSSFANLQDYIDQADEGAELKLSNDYSLRTGGKTLTITKNLTIDGNNHTLSGADQDIILSIAAYDKNIILKNIIFENGKSPESGGAIYNIHSTSSLVLIGCEFKNNNAAEFGGAIYSEGKLDILDSTFESNGAKKDGGAVYSGANLYTLDSTFKSNTAKKDGGAIYSKGQACIESSDFEENHAENDGGAIKSVDKCTIDGCNFNKNIADSYGGAIYADYLTTTTLNGPNKFTNNQAKYQGGAIYAHHDAYINWDANGKAMSIMDSNSVSDHETTSYCGGAIYAKENLYAKFLSFTNNFAFYYGGAIYSVGDAHIANSTFESNNIDYIGEDTCGGAVYGNGKLYIANSSFKSNYAGKSGGAIYCNDEITISNSSFESNHMFMADSLSRNYNGGAIYSVGRCNIDSCTFDNNKAFTDGGAIYCEAETHIAYSEFSGNTAQSDYRKSYGGAIRSIGKLYIDSSTFKNNNAQLHGGAICADSDLTITGQNEFERNTAEMDDATLKDNDGGAIYCYGNAVIDNAHFKHNKALVDGGAIYCEGQTTVSNSIFEKNDATGAEIERNFGGAICSNGKVEITNCSFDYNKADNWGGAIYAYGEISITGSSFEGNYAKNVAAVYASTVTQVSNSVFKKNQAPSNDGGAIYINDKCNPEFTSCTFEENTCPSSGGAIYISSSDSHLTLSYCNFSDNSADVDGGAVFCEGQTTVSNSNFQNNEATGATSKESYGGAIRSIGYITVDNCEFDNNHAYNWGGAVYADGELTIENSNFTGNNAKDAGAVYAGTISQVSGSTFIKNHATSNHGGAICIYHKCNPEFTSCTFEENECNKNGGAVYLDSTNSQLSISNCTFTNNTSENNGGAVYLDSSSSQLSISNCTFTNNTAEYDGGAVFCEGQTTVSTSKFHYNLGIGTAWERSYGGAIRSKGDITLDNCEFYKNNGFNWGGAVYADEEIKITNCNFTGNNAEYAGAVYAGTVSEVSNSIFIGNNASYDGGAINIYHKCHPKFSSCTFEENLCYRNGGAVYLDSSSSGLTLLDCTFVGNAAKTYSGSHLHLFGGAVYASGSIVIQHCNFTSNYATHGGAVYAATIDSPVTDSTFIKNNATTHDGGAIYINDKCSPEFVSCRFEENTCHENGGAIFLYSVHAHLNINHCTFVDNTANGHGQIVYNYGYYDSIERCWFGRNDPDFKDQFKERHAVGSDEDHTPADYLIIQMKVDDDNGIYFGNTYNVTIYFQSSTQMPIEKDILHSTGSFYGDGNFSNIHADKNDMTSNLIFTKEHSTIYGKLDYQTLSLDFDVKNKNISEVKILSCEDVAYPHNLTVTYEITNMAEGASYAVKTDLGEVVSDGGLANSSGTLNVEYLSPGWYTITITNPETWTVLPSNATAKFRVFIPVSLNITADNVTYGTPTTITAKADRDGYYYATIGNQTIELAVVDGTCVKQVMLNAGKYQTNTTCYSSDVKLNCSEASFTVNKAINYVTLNVGNVTYGTQTVIEINATADGNYTVDINGTQITISVKNGYGNNTLSLNAGNYYANVTFDNGNYDTRSRNATFEVYKADTNITVFALDVIYPKEIEGIVYSSQDGKHNLTVGNYSTVLDVINGFCEFNAGLFIPGQYLVNVSYPGDLNHKSNSSSAKVTVGKIPTKIVASSVFAVYNVAENLTITLTDADGNPIAYAKLTVDLNGIKTVTTDESGQANVSTNGLAPKTYLAKITYKSEGDYNDSSINVKVVVKKATPKITAKAKKFKTSTKTKKYTITLKDNTGKAIKHVKVSLKVNGKTYTAKTNSKGKATFKITKLTKTGTFKATVKYKGNKYYTKATKKAKITVVFKTVSKGSKDSATVKKIQRALKNNGFYLTAYGHYLMVDGKYHQHTVNGVKQFQKANGLKVTGKVDEKTAKKLKII